MDKKEKSDFTVRVRIRFCEDNIPVYGNGISELLQCIDQLGSIRAAAKKIGMSYRKALEVIKRAEEHFGEKLLYKQTGGPDGGGSKLTGFGKTLVYQFKVLQEDVLNYAVEKTKEYFPKLLD